MGKQITDDFLYKYIPMAEQSWISVIENSTDDTHTFSKKFRKKYRKLIKESKRSDSVRHMVRVMKRTAAVLAIFVSLSFALCMSVEASRTWVFQFIRKVYEDCTEYRFYSGPDVRVDDDDFISIEPAYVPEGYEVVSKEQDGMNKIIYRKDGDEDTDIYYDAMLAEGTTMLLDTEGAYVRKGTIDTTPVEYFVNKGTSYIYWTDENTLYTIIGSVELEDVKHMCQSIIQSKEYKEKNKIK